MSNLFISLFLAAFVSFSAPVVLIGCGLGLVAITGYIPGFGGFSNSTLQDVLEVLAIFGSGKPFQGVMTLGVTVSIVGVLFDILNFYRYQSLKDQDIS